MTLIDYTALFDALPTSSLLIKANAPLYTIVAASPQHLKDGGVRKEDIIGKSLFEAYPPNPGNPGDTGEINMRESFEYVLRNKRLHRLPVQRYDVVDDKGLFRERYWQAENKPVFSADGEVTFILQTTEELTAQIKAKERESQLEKVNKASEEKYRGLLDSIDQGFCTITVKYDEEGKPVDYKFIEVSPSFENQTGIKDAAGKWMSDIAADQDQFWFETYGRIAEDRKSEQFEYYSTPLARWWSVYAFPVDEPEKKLIGVLFNDITERKKGEEALRESEETFRSYVVANSDIVYKMSADWKTMYSLEGKDFLISTGNASSSWIDSYIPTHEKDRVQQAIEEAITNKCMFELEHQVFDVNGNLAWAYSRALPRMDQQGEIIAWIGAASDITERKSQEQQQAFLLRFSDTLRAELNIDAIANRALQMLSDHLSLDRCYVGVYQLVEDRGVFPYQVGNDRVPPMPASVRLSDFPDAMQVAFHSTLVMDDVAKEEGLANTDRQNLSALGLRAFVAATLRNGEASPSWSIVAISASPRHWKVGEIKLIEEVTERTWAVIERAKAEETLRQSEEKYRKKLEEEVLQRTAELIENKDLLQTVFDASPNSISVFKILYNNAGEVCDFKILSFNPFTIRTIGGRDVIGQKYSEAFPHVVENGVLNEFIKAAKTGEQTEFEKWYFGEGMHHCFRFIANKTGNLLLVTTEDITERIKADEGLKTNLTLLQQSEDLAKIGSWEYEIATGKFTWSNGMYELFGLPKGKNIRPEVYLDYVIDEDYAVAQGILKCFNEPQAFEETLCIKKNDSVREIKIKASIVTDEHGASLKLVGVDLDITEAKEAEKTLKEQAHFIQSTNEALPDTLFVMNLDTKEFTYINHSFEERLGYGVEKESSRTKSMFHLIYEEDIPAILAHIEEMKTAEDSVMYEMEYRLKAADGSLRWYKDRNSVFKRDKSGNVIEKIGIAQDITDSKKAEQKLKESNNSLRYANENLQQFASIASHDLQEPLRKLKMFASVLQRYENELPEEAKAVIQKISLTSVRMRQLITEVLQYSKIAYGTKAFVSTNLDQIFQNVLSDLDVLLADTKANIQYNEPLPEIEAVPLQMNQLFYNLLTNALKFRKDGEKPIIDISYRVTPSAEVSKFPELHANYPYIEIKFSDNGIGFQQEYAEQIFQLFERLFSAEEYEGTGVGLALCKKIAENHNGHIYAESKDGEGAEFYILLPVSQKKAQENEYK